MGEKEGAAAALQGSGWDGQEEVGRREEAHALPHSRSNHSIQTLTHICPLHQ